MTSHDPHFDPARVNNGFHTKQSLIQLFYPLRVLMLLAIPSGCVFHDIRTGLRDLFDENRGK